MASNCVARKQQTQSLLHAVWRGRDCLVLVSRSWWGPGAGIPPNPANSRREAERVPLPWNARTVSVLHGGVKTGILKSARHVRRGTSLDEVQRKTMNDQPPIPPTGGEETLPTVLRNALPAEWQDHRARAGDVSGEEGGTDWRRYLAAVLRYKWLVALTTVIGVGIGIGIVRFVPQEYEAQARIWVETSQGRDQGPIRTGQLLESYAWIDLLKSFAVLDDAVRSLRLYVRPADAADSGVVAGLHLAMRFQPGKYELGLSSDGRYLRLLRADGSVADQAAAGDSLGGPVGFLWQPDPSQLRAGRTVGFEVLNPRDIATGLSRDLVAQTDRQGNFLAVSLQGRDPELTAATVNTVVDRFVELAGQLTKIKITERVAALREQLGDAGSGLLRAEQELESFKVETITLPAEEAVPVAPGLQVTQDPVLSRFFQMRVELDNMQADRDAIQRVLSAAGDSGVGVQALEAIGSVQQSSELQAALADVNGRQAELRALQSQFTDEHPAVQRLAGRIKALETQTIPVLAQALVQTLDTRIASLEGRTESASHEMRQIPPRRIQEARLQRNVTIAENLYTMVQQRYEEARLAEVSSIPDVRVLDPAITPHRPLGSRAIRLFVVAVFGGLGAGLLGAILLDRFDRRFRYPSQVSEQMGLQILGVVPHLKGIRNGRRGGAAAPVVEALRGIRLNLVHAYGTAGPIVITVTSPGSSDGKSFISANLALAFADSGRRTLLIDADSRRGSLHRVIGALRKPGLTDVLSDRLDSGAAIQSTEYPGLKFLGGGTRLPGAPELLGSESMARLVVQLRQQFDVVIVDSPPLGAGVDAYTLGTLTGAMVVVVRTGRTDRMEAEGKLDMLDRLPVRVLGAILNDAKDATGYGYGYYSYYMPGYESEEESEAADLLGEGRK
jgi:capsular exopolysaccharide synthesis family protein